MFVHRSVLLLWCCIACIVGVGVATASVGLPLWVSIALGIGALFSMTAATKQKAFIAGILIGSFCIGAVRSAAIETETAWKEMPAVISATVVREPEIRFDQQRLVVRDTSHEAKGLLQITTALQPRYRFGDVVTLTCSPKTPEAFDGFRYDLFLARQHITAQCFYPPMQRSGMHVSVKRTLMTAKGSVMRAIERVLPAPEHGVIHGVLFGTANALPQDLAEAFRRTGTTHVLVISGSNIVLITGMLSALFTRLPLSRRMAFAFTIAVIVAYVSLTGWQSPAVRAALFGGITLCSTLLGRRGSGIRLSIYAATAMVISNPLLLLYDGGFQLSFLATIGIILWGKWFEQRLVFLPDVAGIRQAAAVTIAAMIPTTPLIAISFHSFSLVALAANIIVVPVISIVMLYGLVLVFAATALPDALAIVLALPLYYIIHFLIQVVRIGASIPYSSIAIPAVPQWTVFFAYVAIAIMAYAVKRRAARKEFMKP